MRWLALLFGLVMLVGAQDSCPWMNAATAAGILGGEVSAKFTPGAKSKSDAPVRVRNHIDTRFDVTNRGHDARFPAKQFAGFERKFCSKGMPLKAIGNEAILCDSGGRERVVGRVRDQAFVITFTRAKSLAPKAAIHAAEIVAGNLF